MLQKADFKLKVSRENALKWKNVLPQNISNETAFTPSRNKLRWSQTGRCQIFGG